MPSAGGSPGTIAMAVGFIGYLYLFARTIRQNRQNRPVVLGTLTVALFLIFFLLYIDLSGAHAPHLLMVSILSLLVLVGVSVLLVVGWDVVKWASGKNETK